MKDIDIYAPVAFYLVHAMYHKRKLKQCFNVDRSVGEDQEDNDADWPLPLRLLKELKRKPDKVKLKLKAKKIPSLLAQFSVANRISIREELKVVASILRLGGADIMETSLSTSTIYRQRKRTIKTKAKEHKENFKCPDHVVIHWDGKIVQVMSGLTEDRVAVVLSSTCGIGGKFLASPAIGSGTGRAQADAVFQVCINWDLINNIRAMCFDTTASNSGHLSGAAVLFERLLGRSLFHLACRHHIAELHVGHANEDCRGAVDGWFLKLSYTFCIIIKHYSS